MMLEWLIAEIALLVLAIILAVIDGDRMMRQARDKAMAELREGLRKQTIEQIEVLNKAGLLRDFVELKEEK